MTAVPAYPLTWPAGWRRTRPHDRTNARFHNGKGALLNIGAGVTRVLGELSTMGVHDRNVIISSDLRTRGDGRPYADQATGHLDPGVAVYWTAHVNGKPVQRCIASDRYDRLADNLAAIAATLDALRAIQRHGGGQILDRAFAGFTALAAPEQWHQILEVSPGAAQHEVDAAHRRLISKSHPDKPGAVGDPARINTARDDAYRQNAWK